MRLTARQKTDGCRRRDINDGIFLNEKENEKENNQQRKQWVREIFLQR